MLPCRSEHYIFPAAIVAACVLAPASWGQSHGVTIAEQPPQRNETSIGGSFKFGAATIDLNHLSLSERLDRQSDQATDRAESSSATFTLNLSDQPGGNLVPESLNLTARKTDIFGRPQFSIGSITNLDPSEQDKSDYVISADWGAPEDRITFSFSSSVLGERFDDRQTTDSSNDMLNFTRTVRTGNWLSSFTASVGRGYRDEPGNRERSRKIGASANFKTTPAGAPGFDITARVLQDRISKLATGSGDIDTRWELRTGSKIFGGSSSDDLTIQPSLSIFFSVKGNAPDEEDEDTKSVDFTAGVTGKVHF